MKKLIPLAFEAVKPKVALEIEALRALARHESESQHQQPWKEVVSGTSIGNQVMLKLAEPVTTDALRLRITQSPACTAISEFSLLRQPVVIHPPVITRDPMGMITLFTKGNVPIHYTVDGGDPDAKSPLYREPFPLPEGGVVRAATLVEGELSGVAVATFGISKAKWSVNGQTNVAFLRFTSTACLKGNGASVAEIGLIPW